jgi:hypothetical protein
MPYRVAKSIVREGTMHIRSLQARDGWTVRPSVELPYSCQWRRSLSPIRIDIAAEQRHG